MDMEARGEPRRPQPQRRARRRVLFLGAGVGGLTLVVVGLAAGATTDSARPQPPPGEVAAATSPRVTPSPPPRARLAPAGPGPSRAPTVPTTTTTAPPTSAAPMPMPTTTTPVPTIAGPAPPTAEPVPTSVAPVAPVAPAGPVAPEPVLVVFDNDHVTLDGAVPSAEASAYLASLAAAYAKATAIIENRLTIDPAVAPTVPVRVVELQSARFASGSAEIGPEHAAELDRVAAVMLALPHVSLLVVGHADQVGSDAANLQLSQARAAAVVNHLIGKGVAADRLSARGVGETDPLADDLGDAALALNRRTEFVFTGILIRSE